MNRLTGLAAALNSPMDTIAECRGLTLEQVSAYGVPETTAVELLSLCDVYFGKSAFSRKQARARQAAQHHNLATLELIERFVRRLKTQREAWALRLQLVLLPADADLITRTAAAELAKKRKPVNPAPGVRVYRRPEGNWTMAITAESGKIADLYSAVDKDKALESVEEIFFPTSAGAPARQRPSVTTHAVITLDQLDEIVFSDGSGDSSGEDGGNGEGSANGEGCSGGAGSDEILVRLTNGATITGAELVRRRMEEHGYVTLVHPERGPVNLYRTQRVASRKQRLMAWAENPVCPWPRCNHPAEECQVHHLKSWASGGQTNPDNLAMVCPYHNGVNDDDPNAPPVRGRLIRRHGTVQWLPPWARHAGDEDC